MLDQSNPLMRRRATLHAPSHHRAMRARSRHGPSNSGNAACPLRDAPATPREQATLRVGAIPWGEVFIDGIAVGRTPLERHISAGEHQIEIRFPVGSPPRSETYRVQLVGGETKRLLADFSAAAGSANSP